MKTKHFNSIGINSYAKLGQGWARISNENCKKETAGAGASAPAVQVY
jgi:hypothetical protein